MKQEVKKLLDACTTEKLSLVFDEIKEYRENGVLPENAFYFKALQTELSQFGYGTLRAAEDQILFYLAEKQIESLKEEK